MSLELKWSLGLSPIPSSVFSLASDAGQLDINLQNRQKILYVQGQNLIVHDDDTKEQILLSGHLNAVCSVSVSAGKRFAASGGEWSETFPPAIIIWDLIANSDIRIVELAPHEGVAAVALSKDSTYLAALIDIHGETESQTLRIWNWMEPSQSPVEFELATSNFHHDLSFSSFQDGYDIVSTGRNGIFTWKWDPNTQSLTSKHGTGFRDLEVVNIGVLQATTFISKNVLLSLSSSGFSVVWRLREDSPPEPRKLLRLQGTTCLCFLHNFFAVGFEDSMIRVYDQDFKLLTWCNNTGVGEIFSLSFPNLQPSNDQEIPECVVAGLKGINRVRFSSEDVEEILDWQVSELTSVAIHPNGDTMCIGTQNGRIELWSLSKKQRALTKTFSSRHGDSSPVTCLEYSACGEWLIAGFLDGAIKFLSMADDLETIQPFKSYSQPIAKIISAPGEYVAVMDCRDAVLTYRFFSRKHGSEGASPKEWVLIGRQHAHSKPIQDIIFSPHSPPRLFSVGFDRIIQEFSLDAGSLQHVNSTMGKGDMLACIYVQNAPSSFDMVNDDMLVTFTTDFKANFWNAKRISRTPSSTKKTNKFDFFENEMSIVQTVLGPAMGSPLARVIWASEELALFSNLDCGLGMFRIPELSWPVRTETIATLPIASMKLLPNKSHALTVGGNGLNLYELHPETLDVSVAKLDHDDYCVSLLGQEEICRLKELFLTIQEMEQSDDGDLGSISIQEMRTIFRLQGHYLNQDATERISAELQMRSNNRRRRTNQDLQLSFEDFLRVYTNNRSYCVTQQDEAQQSFEKLVSKSPTKTLRKRDFVKLLSQKGDKMSSAELSNTMETILGKSKGIPNEIDRAMIDELIATEI